MVYGKIERFGKSEMGKREGKMVYRFFKIRTKKGSGGRPTSKGEPLQQRREIVDVLIEMFAKRDMKERGREFVDGTVELPSKREVGEEGRESIYKLAEIVAKSYAGDSGREEREKIKRI